MPPSPKKVVFTDDTKDTPDSAFRSKDAGSNGNKKTRFYSQPMPTGTTAASGAPASGELPRNPRISKLKDKRYDSFKTFSGRLERQLSNLRGNKNQETEQESISQPSAEMEINIPVDRYFDALEGPELDKLRVCFSCFYPLILVIWLEFHCLGVKVCLFYLLPSNHLSIRKFTVLFPGYNLV